jgi:hypothetical protein
MQDNVSELIAKLEIAYYAKSDQLIPILETLAARVEEKSKLIDGTFDELDKRVEALEAASKPQEVREQAEHPTAPYYKPVTADDSAALAQVVGELNKTTEPSEAVHKEVAILRAVIGKGKA